MAVLHVRGRDGRDPSLRPSGARALTPVKPGAGQWNEYWPATGTKTSLTRSTRRWIGAFFACAAAIPHLRDSRGTIINIASDAGHQGNRNAAAYCASKAALTLLSKTLALDLAPDGIRVNAVSPGDIATPMLDFQAERYGEGDPQGYKRDLLKLYPQGASARFIRPEEIAELVWFLCQPYAEAITGANLAMDFGLSAGK